MFDRPYLTLGLGLIATSLSLVYVVCSRMIRKSKEEINSIECSYFKEFFDSLEAVSVFEEVNGKRLRIISIKHVNAEVPTLFFIHGAGGQAEQWIEQIRYYRRRATIVVIDMVGHGRSFLSTNPTDYAPQSLREDIAEIFHRYKGNQNVFISHSYGTALCTSLYPLVKGYVNCYIFLGPIVDLNPTLKSKHHPWFLPYVPLWLLDIMRVFDKREGIKSHSVTRMLDETALDYLRFQQLKWNGTTPSIVVKNLYCSMKRPTLKEYVTLSEDIPVLLLCGEHDQLTPSSMTEAIHEELLKSDDRGHRHEMHIVHDAGHQIMLEKKELINALMTKFMIKRGHMASLDRLNQINRGNSMNDKWGLKNYEKWLQTERCGRVLGKRGFVPLKVLRQDDEGHSPKIFFSQHPRVGLIIDLTSESPPYEVTDPVIPQYIKLAAVSKKIPTRRYVAEFVEIVKKYWKEHPDKHIAVHCHYGFNRTGFIITSYLISEENMPIQDAIDAFAKARPKGIRHQHFKDELFIRYS